MSNSAKYLQFGLSILLLVVIWVVFFALMFSGRNEFGYYMPLYAFATIFGYFFLAAGMIMLMMRLLNNPLLRQAFGYNVSGTANVLLGMMYFIACLLLQMDHIHWEFLLNLFLGIVIVTDIIRA